MARRSRASFYVGIGLLGSVAALVLHKRRCKSPVATATSPPLSPQRNDAEPKTATGLRVAGVAAVTCLVSLCVATFAPLVWGWQPVVLTSDSMAPWIRAGDIALIDRDEKSPQLFDVVTFDSGRHLITHRVVGQDGGTFLTKGDANRDRDSTPLQPEQIEGTAKLIVPFVGRPAVALQNGDWMQLTALGGLCIAGFFLLGPGLGPRRSLRPIAVATATLFSAVAAVGMSAAAFTSTTANASSFQAGPGYYSTIVSDGPVSYWRLGEASGSPTAVDEMGVAGLTYTSSPVLGVTGALAGDTDTAMTTSGSQRALAPDNTTAHDFTSQVSVEAWIKPSANPNSTNARVVAKYNGSVVSYLLAYDSTGRKMRFLVELQSNSTRPTATSTTDLTDTTRWYHVVGTYDGSAVRVYIDGALEATVSGVAPIKTVVTGLAVGNENAGVTSNVFRGTTDEVSIWSRALTPTEITSHRNRGLGP